MHTTHGLASEPPGCRERARIPQAQPSDSQANLADDFPSPEPTNAHLETMDMSSELANQAAAQAIEHAVAVAASAEASTSAAGAHASVHVHEDGQHLPDSSSLSPHVSRHASPSLASITYRAQQDAHQQHQHQHQPQASHHQHPPQQQPQQQQQQQTLELSNSEQLVILRESYARNPNPDRKELDRLAERTGRPWNKIREYFRQRRNKLRGLRDLERMEEPGRASGW